MAESIIRHILCNSPTHKRVEGWACKKHLFTVLQDGDVMTISKRCPDCKTENTLTIIKGRVRPPQAAMTSKEDAHVPVEQASLTPRQG